MSYIEVGKAGLGIRLSRCNECRPQCRAAWLMRQTVAYVFVAGYGRHRPSPVCRRLSDSISTHNTSNGLSRNASTLSRPAKPRLDST